MLLASLICAVFKLALFSRIVHYIFIRSIQNKSYYNSVAYQAVSTNLPEGCVGFVPWFLVL